MRLREHVSLLHESSQHTYIHAHKRLFHVTLVLFSEIYIKKIKYYGVKQKTKTLVPGNKRLKSRNLDGYLN